MEITCFCLFFAFLINFLWAYACRQPTRCPPLSPLSLLISFSALSPLRPSPPLFPLWSSLSSDPLKLQFPLRSLSIHRPWFRLILIVNHFDALRRVLIETVWIVGLQQLFSHFIHIPESVRFRGSFSSLLWLLSRGFSSFPSSISFASFILTSGLRQTLTIFK